MGATGIASDIKTLGYILQQAQGSTFITQYGENHVTSGGTVYMNIVMVNLVAGTDVATVLKSADDLDGKLVIGENTVLDMTDTYSATHVLTQQQVGYGNAGVAQLIGGYAGQAPVFSTAVGGVGVINADYQLVTDLTADPTTNAMNAAALTMGDYIALYMNNMGIVLGYNMD